MPQLPDQTVFSQGSYTYQDQSVNPAAFGATVGPALEKAGDTASEIALTRQSLWNEKQATDAVTGLANQNDDITTDYRSRLGTHAVQTLDETKKKLNDNFQTARAQLSPAAQRLYDFQASRILRGSLNEVDSHWDGQFKQSMVDTSQARIDAAARTGFQNYNDPSRIAQNLVITNGEVQKKSEFLGLSPEATQQAQALESNKFLLGVAQAALTDQNIPAARGVLTKFNEVLDPRVKGEIEAQIKRTQQAAYIDQEHARTVMLQQREENDRAYFNKSLNALNTNSLTAGDILKSTASPELKYRLMEMVKAKDKEEAAPVKTDPVIFHSLMSDTLQGKIPDEKAYADAFAKGQVNFQDLTRLQQEFQYARTPDGSTLASTRHQFDQSFRREMDKSEMGLPDPAGPENWYNFNRFVDSKIKQYRQDGKNPNDLFDPQNADYVAKVIPMFQRTPQEIIAAQSAALKANVNRKNPKAGDVVKGYRFKGGNPAEPASWEKAQ